MSAWKKTKKKKGKTSKFVDAGSSNWNERQGITAWNGSTENRREKLI